MMKTPNNDFHSIMKETNNRLPFIINSHIAMLLYLTMETTNNDLHSTIEATNHWLPFTICRSIKMVSFQQWKQQRMISIQ